MSRSKPILTERQGSLLVYWSSICSDGQLPCRRSVNPGALGGALGNTSLVEKTGDRYRFRLTGSRLEGVFGRDVKGQVIDEIDANVAEAGSASMAIALDTKRPVSGNRQIGTRWHCWLRLPLMDDEGNASLVLCLDEFPKVLPGKMKASSGYSFDTEHRVFAA